jgi:hypothetical protein
MINNFKRYPLSIFSGLILIIPQLLYAQLSHVPNLGLARQGVSQIKLYQIEYHKTHAGWSLKDPLTNQFYGVDSNFVSIYFFDGVADSSKQTLLSTLGLNLFYQNESEWVTYHTLNSNLNYFDIIDAIDKSEFVYHVNVPHFMELAASISPDDPWFASQWYMQTIDIEQAWDITTGSPDVLVAVIDGNGVNFTNDDLGKGSDSYDNFYRNQITVGSNPADGEEAWTAVNPLGDGIDTDNNSKTDDWRGWNFQFDNNNLFETHAHGDIVASVISAKINNDHKMAGIAGGWNGKGVEIISLKAGNGPAWISSTLAVQAFDYAIEQNVDIINYSAGGSGADAVFNAAVSRATAAGILFVAASGNDNNSAVWAPARYNGVLGVGGSDTNDFRAIWQQGAQTKGANFGTGLNVAAPAKDILTIANNNAITVSGTSLAAPIVSGIAALMLSVNNCLSNRELKDIIENTAEKVGGYNYGSRGISNEFGHGRVNAFEAVKVANETKTTELDLYLKDDVSDFGQSPSPTIYTDNGPDIWVRRTADGMDLGDWHRVDEPLVYTPNDTFYVYVRVRNKSCFDATAGNIDLHFSKLGTAFSWPNNWNGSNQVGDFGGLIGSKQLGIIEAGKSKIFDFEWIMSDFSNILGAALPPNTVNACLLARIENVPNDLITPISANTALYSAVKNDNNLTMKNVVIRNAQFFAVGGEIPVWVGGTEIGLISDIGFHRPEYHNGHPLDEEAEILVRFDNLLWDRWVQGGQQLQDVVLVNDVTQTFKVIGQNPEWGSLEFLPAERGRVYISIHFLVENQSSKTDFMYHFYQSLTDSETIVGAVHLLIDKEARDDFDADAGYDDVIDENEFYSLKAIDIGEPATYKWYTNDTLIDSTRIALIQPDTTQNYRLEVQATSDGFKDYDEVKVAVNVNWIQSVIPNPASSLITIEYKLPPQAQSCYFKITNTTGVVMGNFSCNLAHHQRAITLASYSAGNYHLSLIVDGVLIHQVPFIKL